jgi:S1-C subfamily serine protease
MRSRADLARLAAALGGLPVLGCLEGSPAAEAGVRYGDVLLAINGNSTATWDDFIEARRVASKGFTARIFREGTELDIAVSQRTGPLPSPLEMLLELHQRRVA